MRRVQLRDEDGLDNPSVNTLRNDGLAKLKRVVETRARNQLVPAIVMTGAGRRAFASDASLNEFQQIIG